MGWQHRRAELMLVLVLPDGTRALLPAAWTDLHGAPIVQPATLASLKELIQARTVVNGLLRRCGAPQREAPPPEMDERSRAATVDELRGDKSSGLLAGTAPVWEALDQAQRTEVVATLARLIAKVVEPPKAAVADAAEKSDE
jgi:hypothetical protein